MVLGKLWRDGVIWKPVGSGVGNNDCVASAVVLTLAEISRSS